MRLDLLLSHISCCNVCFPIFIFLQCLEGSKEQPVSKHFTIWLSQMHLTSEKLGRFLFEAVCVKSHL